MRPAIAPIIVGCSAEFTPATLLFLPHQAIRGDGGGTVYRLVYRIADNVISIYILFQLVRINQPLSHRQPSFAGLLEPSQNIFSFFRAYTIIPCPVLTDVAIQQVTQPFGQLLITHGPDAVSVSGRLGVILGLPRICWTGRARRSTQVLTANIRTCCMGLAASPPAGRGGRQARDRMLTK